VVKAEKLRRILLLFAFRLGRCKDSEKEGLQRALRLGYAKYLHIAYFKPTILAPPARVDRDIESFSDSDCYIFFRFTKPHLRELLVLLKLDIEEEDVEFDNNEHMRGEEIFLRGLYELVSGETQHKIATNVFGRDGSSQSRALLFFINHMFDNFAKLIQGNVQWWYDNNFL
jgi:hypothetical protein